MKLKKKTIIWGSLFLLYGIATIIYFRYFSTSTEFFGRSLSTSEFGPRFSKMDDSSTGQLIGGVLSLGGMLIFLLGPRDIDD